MRKATEQVLTNNRQTDTRQTTRKHKPLAAYRREAKNQQTDTSRSRERYSIKSTVIYVS